MIYRFKTNINCSSCVAKVTPYLDAHDEIKHWEVDTQNPQKILTIETDNLRDEEVRDIVNTAGYRTESLNL